MPALIEELFQSENFGLSEAAIEERKLEIVEVSENVSKVTNIRLHASNSNNGYKYSGRSMVDLKEDYEKRDISADHNSKEYMKFFGIPKDMYFTDYEGNKLSEEQVLSEKHDVALWGDVMVNKKKPVGEAFLADVEMAPGHIKMSHEVAAGNYKRTKNSIIERAKPDQPVKARRIALIVGDGGVNNGLQETHEDEEMNTVAELKEKYPLIYEAVVQEGKTCGLSECACQQAGGANEQVKSLKTEKTEFESTIESKDAEIGELKSKLSKFEKAMETGSKVGEIIALAEELKVACSEELAESYVSAWNGDNGKELVTSWLKVQPDLQEDAEPKKRGQLPKRKVNRADSKKDSEYTEYQLRQLSRLAVK